MQPTQHVQIPQHQHPFRDNPDRIPILGTDFQAGPRQLQRGFQWLVTIGIPREQNQFTLSRRFLERPAEQSCGLPLHDDLRLEIGPGAEPPILMRWSRVTIRAGVKTSAIGVEAPSKRQIGTLVPTENVTGRILKHVELHMGSRLQKISVL